MNRKNTSYIIIYITIILMIMLLAGVLLYVIFSATGKKPERKPSTGSASEETIVEQGQQATPLYLVLDNDSVSGELYVYSYEDGKEYYYSYGLATEFYNQYGSHIAPSQIYAGRIVALSQRENAKELKEVFIPKELFELSDISNYSMDLAMGIVTVGENRYSMDRTRFFSEKEEIQATSISGKEKMLFIGNGKQILSAVVKSGMGKLSVHNSKDEIDFKGGYLQIGSKIFAKITGDMELEIPEGTYQITAVSPKGYGDSTEMTIERGQTRVLDLATLEGEGPQKGRVTFLIDDPGAVLKIDKEIVDSLEDIELVYGIHSFVITTEDYEDYSKYLFVHSEKATVHINLSEVGILKEQQQEETVYTETESETETGTESETETEEESQTSKKETQSTDVPKVPTASELIEQEKDKIKG